MLRLATFAAGCFWGVEEAFLASGKVVSTAVGYCGGSEAVAPRPSYQQVCTGSTGHAEAVQVTFDPECTAYPELLAIFWSCHDPTQLNRQGPDIGTQYRSMLFYHDHEQRLEAEHSRATLQAKGVHVVTEITPFAVFHRAEEHHQQYFRKHPDRAACHK